MTAIVTTIATPFAMKSAVSRPVAKLKCDGTPRARCTDTHATSVESATASAPSSHHAARRGSVRYEVIQPSVRVVIPKAIPNVTGLRHPSGPSHGPPDTAQTARWTSPTATRTVPTT